MNNSNIRWCLVNAELFKCIDGQWYLYALDNSWIKFTNPKLYEFLRGTNYSHNKMMKLLEEAVEKNFIFHNEVAAYLAEADSDYLKELYTKYKDRIYYYSYSTHSLIFLNHDSTKYSYHPEWAKFRINNTTSPYKPITVLDLIEDTDMNKTQKQIIMGLLK